MEAFKTLSKDCCWDAPSVTAASFPGEWPFGGQALPRHLAPSRRVDENKAFRAREKQNKMTVRPSLLQQRFSERSPRWTQPEEMLPAMLHHQMDKQTLPLFKIHDTMPNEKVLISSRTKIQSPSFPLALWAIILLNATAFSWFSFAFLDFFLSLV